MKILRIQADGLSLFKEPLDISFTTSQRFSNDDKDILFHLFSNVYINTTTAIIGINASGKTSVLNVILLALGIVNKEPINHVKSKDILGKSPEATFTIYYHLSDNEICKLQTIIKYNEDTDRYIIKEEKMWKKPTSNIATKKYTFVFNETMLIKERDNTEEFLPDDISIIIAQNKKLNEHIPVTDMLSFTNVNVLPISDNIPLEIINFLDPTIEALFFEDNEAKSLVHLKFYGNDEIILNTPAELEHYLSSGTIKGIIAFTKAMATLKNGGYMIIDEIENHFNKEIVTTLIRFFMDTRINRNGAGLIFSTHYPELLDEYDRNDSIFITRNRNGITAENLSNILKRNDIKKSDAYQSGFLDGTTPAYEAYLQLKKSISAYI